MSSWKFDSVSKILVANGFRLVRINGSHYQFKKAGHDKTVTVSFHNRDIPIGTLKSIERQSGLSFR